VFRSGCRRSPFIESFNGKFQDECLNDNVFDSIAEARELIERWRVDYNECRPHRSLGQMTPSQLRNSMKPARRETVKITMAKKRISHRADPVGIREGLLTNIRGNGLRLPRHPILNW